MATEGIKGLKDEFQSGLDENLSNGCTGIGLQ